MFVWCCVDYYSEYVVKCYCICIFVCVVQCLILEKYILTRDFVYNTKTPQWKTLCKVYTVTSRAVYGRDYISTVNVLVKVYILLYGSLIVNSYAILISCGITTTVLLLLPMFCRQLYIISLKHSTLQTAFSV